MPVEDVTKLEPVPTKELKESTSAADTDAAATVKADVPDTVKANVPVIKTAAEGEELFSQGKRHLYVNDISAAVNSLQEACSIYADLFGETGKECADVYFYYGKALLELARMENGVLGNALDGVPEGADADSSQVEDPEKMTEAEKDMVSEIVGEAIEENFTENEKKQNGKSKESEPDNSEEKMDTDAVESSETEPKKDAEEISNKSPSKDTVTENKESPAKVNGDAKESPAKVNGDSKESPAKVNGDSKESPTKVNGDSKESPAKVNSESKSSPAKVNGNSEQSSEEMEVTDDKKEKETKKESTTEGEDDEDDEATEENNDEAETEETSEKEPEGEQTEEDEDVSNLQLAWEMLELSKLIYSKEENTEKNKLKVAEINLKLGEVGLESENYPQSVEDFTSCLKMQEELLEVDDRRLAETHYQMGVGFSFSDDFDKAIESFTAAAKVIDTRLTNLKAKVEKLKALSDEERVKQEKEDQPILYIEGEIDELEKLLPEVKEKLVDMEEMKKDSKEKLQKMKESAFAGVLGGSRGAEEGGFSGSFSEPSSSSSVKPAACISHLVKKKRKPEEEVETSEAKKVKGENGEVLTNGDTKVDETVKSDSKAAV